MIAIRYPVLIVFVISLIGAAVLGFGSFQLQHDKLIHFATFMVLTVELWFVFESKRGVGRKIRLGVVCVVVTASVFSEVVQSMVNPSRVFDVYDIVYNVLGSSLGVAVGVAYEVLRGWRDRRQYRAVTSIEDDYVEISMGDVEPERDIA